MKKHLNDLIAGGRYTEAARFANLNQPKKDERGGVVPWTPEDFKPKEESTPTADSGGKDYVSPSGAKFKWTTDS